MHTSLRPAFAHDQLAGIVFRIHPQLPHDGPLVADQPLVIDLIILRVAISDNPVVQFFAGGRPNKAPDAYGWPLTKVGATTANRPQAHRTI